jgi:hypothetical protein
VCEKLISGEVPKFHVGVSDNASNVTLALKSETVLEAPEELRARAMVEPEESDDDEENLFATLAAMHEGSAGCFAHLLNLIVEVNTK